MKTCSKCGLVKDESDFYRMSMAHDGLRPECKICTKIALNAYARSEKGKAADKARRVRDKQKVYARDMLRCHVRRGHIIRGPCEIAGCKKKAQGHHEDYSKPFDVNWLCTEHHNELHRKEQDESNKYNRSTQTIFMGN